MILLSPPYAEPTLQHDVKNNISASHPENSADIEKLRSTIAERCRMEAPPLIACYEQLLVSDTIDTVEFHRVETDCGIFIKSVLGNNGSPEEIYGSLFPSLDRNVINTTALNAFMDNGGRELFDISGKALRRLSGI